MDENHTEKPGAIRQKIDDFFELIKFEHTIFALPFAYLGMLLAPTDGWPTWHQFFWITVAMASARTMAMGANRIIDRAIDAENPRTAGRPLPSGRVKLSTAWVGTALSVVILTAAAWRLGPLPLTLLPGAAFFLIGYSFTKRVTWLCHVILGFTDGLAPMGAWAAVRGSLFMPADLPAWLLLGAVTTWIGGFDLIYAGQDVDFDRKMGLHSIPARFGVATALRLSTLCHVVTVPLLLWLGVQTGLGWPYWVGMLGVTGLLTYEHLLVRPGDLSGINVAFFNINGYVSVTLFASVLAALCLS